MKRNKFTIRYICFLVILFITILPLYSVAQSHHHSDRGNSQLLTATDVTNSIYSKSVAGDLWDKLDPNATNTSVGHVIPKDVRAYLYLQVDHDFPGGGTPQVFEPYTYRVLVSVRGYTTPKDLGIYNDFTDTLTISYDPDSINAYQDQHYRTYYGYYKIDVEIIDIYDWTCMYLPINDPNYCSTPPTTGFIGSSTTSSMALNWYLEAGIAEQKYDIDLLDGGTWKSASGSTGVLDISFQSPASSNDNYVTINWGITSTDRPSPDLYELEWTYVDNYNVTFQSTSTTSSDPSVTAFNKSVLKYNFKNNSTRIITDKDEYKIPLIYKNGYLVFRVRLIRPDASNYQHFLYGPWTIAADEGIVDNLDDQKDYIEINQSTSQLDDKFNWNYQVSFAEEGKSKSIVSYYDGLLKNRQTITKLNTLPSLQIVAETYYDHEGKPVLQTLPIPIGQEGLMYVNGFAYPSGSSTTTYKASDVDNKQPALLTALDAQSPAYNYYSSSNSLYQSGSPWKYLKGLPDAEGFPLIHTQYSPEDGRVIYQGGVGKELQIGKGHDTRNYYLVGDQFELDKYFGYNIGTATFYDKTVTRDPNKQLSFNITNNKGQTIMSGLMGYPVTPATSPLLLPDGVTVPSDNPTNFPPIDILYGNTRSWNSNVGIYNTTRFIEKSGNVILDHSITLPNFSPCNGTYLNLPLTYNIDVIDEYATIQNVATGTVGSLLAGTTNTTPSTVTNSNMTVSVDVGKSVFDYKVTYDPSDIDAAVDAVLYPVAPIPTPSNYVSPYPTCLKTEADFIDEEVDKINMDCDDFDDESECDMYLDALKSELYPNQKYGTYTIDGNGNIYAGSSAGLFSNSSGNINTNVYKYQDYLYELSTMSAQDLIDKQIYNNTGYSFGQLIDMDVYEFINRFNDQFAELFLGFHPEYCKYKTTIKPFCGTERYIDNLLDISTLEEANVLGYYPLSSSTPLTDMAKKDPAAVLMDNTPSQGYLKFMYMDVYHSDASTPQYYSERLDHIAFTKTFCNGDVNCRSLVYGWSESQLIADLDKATTENRNRYYYELSNLYVANRKTKIERRRATLLNSTCGTALTNIPTVVIEPQVITVGYDSESDKVPNDDVLNNSGSGLDNGSNVINNTVFNSSNSAATTQTYLSNNSAYGSATLSGYTEYAEEIVKKLANCRKNVSPYNYDAGALQTALVTYMTSNGASNKKWKGGLTPDALATILTSANYDLDDLCNPYLVDYLKGPETIVDGSCRESNFYTSYTTFLNSIANSVQILAISSASQSSMVTGGVIINTNNSFEEELAKALGIYVSGTTSYQIDYKVSNDVANKTLTIYLYKDNDFSISRSVIIYYKLDENVNPSHVDWANMEYIGPNASTTNLIIEDAFCWTNDKQQINTIPVNSKMYISDFNYNLYGTISGLNSSIPDQQECLTCVELENEFTAFQSDVMSASTGYSIQGKGHPYFEDVLRSFLNYKFQRGFTAKEYLDFMKGCDLAQKFYIPEYYAYAHLSSTDSNSLNTVYNTVKNYNGGKYSTFNNFYYFKTNTSNVITEGNLYIDFNSFAKNDLRTMRDLVQTTNSGIVTNQPTLSMNSLEYSINSSLTFADLFVHYIPGASDHNPYVTNAGIAPPNMNWVPNLCALNQYSCNSTGTDYVSVTDEIVTVRNDNLLLPFRHYSINLVGPNVNSISKETLSNLTYWYNTTVLPDDSRGFRSMTQYWSSTTIDNLNFIKQNYLDYTYSKTAPTNSQQKRVLIEDLQPANLQTYINGVSPYTANYGNYPYVSYYNSDKGINSGDLYLKTNSSNSTGYSDLYNIITTAYSSMSSGNHYFPNNYTYTFGNETVTIRTLANNVVWYNLVHQTTNKHRNIWIQLPSYLPSQVDDLNSGTIDFSNENFQMYSVTLLPGSDNNRRFKMSIGSAGTGSAPLDKYYPAIIVYGKTDFDMNDATEVFENVMLCSDYGASDYSISTCYETQLTNAYDNGKTRYLAYMDSVKRSYVDRFTNHIKNNIDDQLDLRMPQSKYIVTLYGYDRAGNLAYTVPPQGVKDISTTSTNLDLNAQYRNDPFLYINNSSAIASIIPGHTKMTTYEYNSLNQLTNKTTPDGGEVVYYYDQAGRLIFSQNAKQEAEEKGSYTLYDEQNRIIETGEVKISALLQNKINDLSQYKSVYDFDKTINASVRYDVIHTFYDEELFDLSTVTGMSRQDFLRNRVATVASYKFIGLQGQVSSNYTLAIHYSYDVSGNVKTLTYDMPMLKDVHQDYKRIDYDYDLYSGKVTLVSYNRSFADQYYQRYSYDADNRITLVETSKDGLLWDDDAVYTYYPHGPLARVSLGDLKVQGVDFVYTLQGWLKSINGDTPDPNKDYGGDGTSNSQHQQDLVRGSLYYFKDDYKPIDPTDYTDVGGTTMTKIPDLDQNGAMQSLYNGNIAAMLSKPGYLPALYSNYQYDQLNRIKSASYKLPDYTATNAIDVLKNYSHTLYNGGLLSGQTGITADDIFKTNFTYDWDGNITALTRNGLFSANGKYDYTSGSVYRMDDLTYHYEAPGTIAENNKLINYEDAANHVANSGFSNDLANYTNVNAATTYRFDYDEIGNLKSDQTNGLNSILWNVYGKVTHVDLADPNQFMSFVYDPMNNRFMKTIKDNENHTEKNEYYIRDAGGNVLAIYRQEKKYLEGLPTKTTLGSFTNHPTITSDLVDAYANNGTFSVGLINSTISTNPAYADNTLASYNYNFFMSASTTIKNAVINGTPNVVADMLQADPTIITDVLTQEYDEQFFDVLLYDSTLLNRQNLYGIIVDSTDTTTMYAIAEDMIPGAYVVDQEDFINMLEYARTHVSRDHFHTVLKTHITGQKLTDAVDNLLADNEFMTEDYQLPYGTISNYLMDIVQQKGDETKILTYYGNRGDANTLVEQNVTVQDRLYTVYQDDPVTFIQNLLNIPEGPDILNDALMGIPGMSPNALMDALITVRGNDQTYTATEYTEVLDYSKTYLAEHILYGSSRLGIKAYWPTQYSFQWDAGKNAADNIALLQASPFHYQLPWYFMGYNSLILANSTNPYGNPMSDKASASRVLGLKRYELTNHLGNVMAVVTDKQTVVPQNPTATLPSAAYKRAALFATYDYYPFGMLMPERYVEDNTPQCVPVTYTKMVKTKTLITELPLSSADMNLFTPFTGTRMGYITGSPDEIVIDGNNVDPAGAELVLTSSSVTTGVEVELTTHVVNNDPMHQITVTLIQDDGMGNDVQLDQATVDVNDIVTLTGTAVSSLDMRVEYATAGTAGMNVLYARYYTVDQIGNDIVAIICNDDGLFGTDYRYGFNGQQKDNEITGTGNSNTAMFWQYDTRLGRRWNLDPVDQIGISNYAVFGNSPIIITDPLGDKLKYGSREAKADVKYLRKHDAAFAATYKTWKKQYRGKNDLLIRRTDKGTSTLNEAVPTGGYNGTDGVNNKTDHLDYTAIKGAHQGEYSILYVSFSVDNIETFTVKFTKSLDVDRPITAPSNIANNFSRWQIINDNAHVNGNSDADISIVNPFRIADPNSPITTITGKLKSIDTHKGGAYQNGVTAPASDYSIIIRASSNGTLLKVPRTSSGKYKWDNATIITPDTYLKMQGLGIDSENTSRGVTGQFSISDYLNSLPAK